MKWNTSRQIGKKLDVKKKTEVRYFDLEHITYIMCEGHHCSIYLINDSGYRVRRSLKYFEQLLEECGFFRINRNTLVNARYICDVQLLTTKRTLHVKVIKNESLIVSRRKSALFKKS